jgi:hypothetical protein
MTNSFSCWRHRIFFQIVMLALPFAISCGKKAEPAPKPQAPPPVEFLGSWGEKGDGPGKLNSPVAFTSDTNGRVYFADPGSGFVHKFESNGVPLQSFEYSGTKQPSGIAVDSGGAIYLADAERGNILIFFPDGTFFQTLHIPPQRHFTGTFEFSVDIPGHIYVPDFAGQRILKFSSHGQLMKSWKIPQDTPAKDEHPGAVAVAPDDSTFVAVSPTGRIYNYSPDGALVKSWNAGEASGSARYVFTGLAVSGEFVFTVSATSPHLRVWTLDGQHKLDDDLAGHLDGVAAPQIAATPGGEVLIFDPAAPRVLRFRLHLQIQEPK